MWFWDIFLFTTKKQIHLEAISHGSHANKNTSFDYFFVTDMKQTKILWKTRFVYFEFYLYWDWFEIDFRFSWIGSFNCLNSSTSAPMWRAIGKKKMLRTKTKIAYPSKDWAHCSIPLLNSWKISMRLTFSHSFLSSNMNLDLCVLCLHNFFRLFSLASSLNSHFRAFTFDVFDVAQML